MVRRTCLVAAGLLVAAACGYPEPPVDSSQVATTIVVQASPSPGALPADSFQEGADRTPVKLPNGLQYVDLKVGTGDAVANPGQSATVHYTGWLQNGKEFDSSRTRGQPFTFDIGKRQVIRGWDDGISGMRVGGRRRLIIPPALAYGDKGSPPAIPPRATLIFVIELLSLKPTPAETPSPSPSPT